MMLRRRYDRANPQTEQPARESAPPDAQLDDAGVHAEIAGIMKEYLAACQTGAPEPTAPKATPAPETAKMQPQVARSASAIRYSVPLPQSAQPASTSLKQALLRQSAMPPAVQQGGIPFALG